MSNVSPHFVSRFRPNSLTVQEASIEPSALSGFLSQSGRGDAQGVSGGFDVVDKVGMSLHDRQDNEKYLTAQRKTSHSTDEFLRLNTSGMNESENFRANLLRLMADAGLSAAELSRRAGLNPRAVKDIEERNTVSPKLSTVVALAKALNADPAEMMGLPTTAGLRPELVRLLTQYDEDEQARLLAALSILRPPRA
ncbi:MAG: family transcriptional regulator [Chthoniobacter sp.]|nr:family transcriptional regulator [Chthoniobacter sp.]